MEVKMERKRFARAIVNGVRDRTIHALDRMMSGALRGELTDRMKELLITEEARAVVTYLIPDIVDEVVGEVLSFLEKGEIEFHVTTSDGEIVRVADLGMDTDLASEYLVDDGWIKRFSVQRWHSYLGVFENIDVPGSLDS